MSMYSLSCHFVLEIGVLGMMTAQYFLPSAVRLVRLYVYVTMATLDKSVWRIFDVVTLLVSNMST